MAGPRRTAALALPVAVLLSLTGCGADEDPQASPTTPGIATSSPSTTSSPTPSGTSTAPTPVTITDPADPSAAPTATTCEAAGRIRDGSWEGPVSLDMQSEGGGSEFEDTAGTGSLRVVVADGRVVTGSWTARWRSTGRAETESATAKIVLTGTIGGSIGGSAREPVLTETWRVRGTATVIRPQQAEFPIDESGTARLLLQPRAVTCDRVNGSFATTFTSKEAQATFTGTATWRGTRTG